MEKQPSIRKTFVVVFVSFLMSTIVSLASLHIINQSNVRSVNKVLAMQVFDHINGMLSEPITVTRTMANDTFMDEALAQESAVEEQQIAARIGGYLQGIKNGFDYDSAFVVSDVSKRYYTPDGINKVINPDEGEYDKWYPEFVDSGVQYAVDVNVDELQGGVWSVFVDARVEDEKGALLGVCGVGMRMAGIQELIRRFEWDYGVKVTLVDPTGLVEVAADPDAVESVRLDSVPLSLSDGTEYVYHRQANGGFAVTKYVKDLGWFLVVQSDGAVEANQFANVIFLNLALCALVMVSLFVTARVSRKKTDELAKASFRDQSTMLYNRRAFEEDKAQMLDVLPGEDFVYVTIDINGLKTANDTLGHLAGDELICGAADCMREHLGPYGKVYRIGGDEFAAMLNVSADKFDEVMENFKRAVDAWHGKLVDGLSVSCGFASRREFPSETLTVLGVISDERMYEDKRAYYERMGIDPRRT